MQGKDSVVLYIYIYYLLKNDAVEANDGGSNVFRYTCFIP